MRITSLILTLCGILLAPLAAQAEVKLPAIIGSNMVLQRDQPLKIWGWASPEEKISVKIGAATYKTSAAPDTTWSVTTDPLKGGKIPDIVITGTNTITLTNVLAGDVWVCSGQSNMYMSVDKTTSCGYGGVTNAKEEIAGANFPEIRLFQTCPMKNTPPLINCQGQWVVCSPETVPNFSATGYFFGRELHQRIKQPIGLIQSAVGATAAESWTPRAAFGEKLDNHPALGYAAQYPKEKDAYEKQMADWKKKADEAKAKGLPAPREPRKPATVAGFQSQIGNLYESYIRPLIPFGIKGVIWYQGESNVSRAFAYSKLMPLMIQSWRTAWGQGDFAFLQVQLANFHLPMPEPGESDWAELREAQDIAAKALPYCGMATAIDIGDGRNIHPLNKQDVGKRLALAALKTTYGQKIVASGPTYKGVKFDAAKAVIQFDNIGGGLVAKGEKLKGFAIAGEDKKFVRADAAIQGDTVVLQSVRVGKPVAVRHLWADNPEASLYNKEGLPAPPFRTDNWPGVTAPKP